MGFVVRLQDRPSLLNVSLESGLVQVAAVSAHIGCPSAQRVVRLRCGTLLYGTAARRSSDGAIHADATKVNLL